jgi:hypothetical protein
MCCRAICILRDVWTWYPGVGWFISILGALGVAVAILRDLTKISGREKAVWIAITFALLLLELHSISLDRAAHDKEQRDARTEQLREFDRIARGIDTTIENSDKQFKSTTTNFGTMMSNNLQAQRGEKKSFIALLGQEQELLTRQEELYEFSAGKLLPANDPTPTVCGPLGENEFMVQMGDSGYVTDTFPFTVLEVAGEKVISNDKSDDGSLLVSLKLIASDGRVIVKISKNGLVNQSGSGLFVSRDKSSLLIEDSFEHEVINARYLNKHVFRVTGIVPYRKRVVALPIPIMHGCVRSSGGGTAVAIN